MLDVITCRKIGINACIDKLGREFVMARKDTSTTAFGRRDSVVFCFVGVDTIDRNALEDGMLVLDSQSVFPYRVGCNVSLENGACEFTECVLP